MSKPLDLFIPTKAPSFRQQKVGQEIRHRLAEIIMRGDIPPHYNAEGELISLPCPVTITGIQVSPDLHHATVYIMPLGGLMQEETISFLKLASKTLRKLVGDKLRLRLTPTLHFQIDHAFAAAEKIDTLLKKI